MMKNPAHPGEVLKSLYLEPLGITITEAAKALDMPRAALSEILNTKRRISPQVAVKMEKAFGIRAGLLLDMQTSFDLSTVDLNCAAKVKRIEATREVML